MSERELCPLCGVPLEDEPGPVLQGDCPAHGVIGRLKGVDDLAPSGLFGQEDEGGLSVWSAAFEETLPVGTAGWRRVDAFEIGEGGDAARGFAVVDELDCFRSTQKLRYPDGTTVETQGMAHEGGRATWTLEGLQPGHDTLIIVQTDVMYAGGDLRLEAGGFAVDFPDFAADRRYRARNRAVPIPGTWVEGETLSVALGRLESDKPLSHFAVWVYQSRTPVPEPFEDESLVDESLVDESLVDEPVDASPALEGRAEEPEAPAEAEAGEEEAVSVELQPPPAEVAAPEAPEPEPEAESLAPADEPPVAAPPEDEAQETVDIPASALLEPPDATPAPLGLDDADEAVADSAAPSEAAEPEPPAEPPAAEPAQPAPASEPPVAEPPSPPVASRPAGPDPAPVAATPRAAEQKLVTITLADADHAHGTGHAHLASELRAGWRIAKLECLPGPRGGWLVVLLER